MEIIMNSLNKKIKVTGVTEPVDRLAATNTGSPGLYRKS